jgi:biotin synthase-related radical SAM superfamily protein
VRWIELKAVLLSRGTANLTGAPADAYISRSAAGPGAGGSGSVFFSLDNRCVRLAIDPESSILINHQGCGKAVLVMDGVKWYGRLEPIGLHCPRQAYITISGSCIYHCRYCPVPVQGGRRKSVDEIVKMVSTARDRIDAIAITSGVAIGIREEEAYVISVIKALIPLGIPMGVSIYPTPETPRLLHELGVVEVKFNLETATSDLFTQLCPGLDRDLMWQVLKESVDLIGRGHVFSNVIIGLGESDEEMRSCIRALTSIGVIPVLRPLNPAAELSGFSRPSPERLMRLADFHQRALEEAGLDPCQAISMCTACTGCDLVPGRDIS